MIDFNEAPIFAAVAEQMSFTRAATTLEISKAAVSRAIANLESRLSVRLFERTTRRLRLTEAGVTYLAFVRRSVEESQHGEAAVSRLNERPRGTLRIVMPVTLAQSSMAPGLACFLETYPELTLDIQLKGGQTDPIAHHVDVVFQTARPEKDSQTIQKRLALVSMGIYASSSYLAKARPLRTPADLVHHSCLTLLGSRAGRSWSLTKDVKTQQVEVRSRVAVGDPSVHHRLCLDGLGVAILPTWLIRNEVKTGDLIRVLPAYTPEPIELYVLYPTRLSMTPKLNVFLDFIQRVVPGSTWK